MKGFPSWPIYLFLVFIFSCKPKPDETGTITSPSVSEWPIGVTYEIFVQSFYDTDGNGIGDFNGLTEKIPYLVDLGVEAVWLMPIMPSPTYHKYDVTDYRAVHPDYGTMDEFKTFVQQAHKNGIKVVIDLIINHSSVRHPWFQKALENDPQFRPYYVWADRDSIADQVNKKETTGDSGNITQWHEVEGDGEGELYYGFFWGGMPDLNFDHQPLREEIYDIGRFWLTEIGVDGFRLDAAKHIYPDERPEDNHAFWVEFREEMEKVKPDVYLIGEVWATTEVSAPYTRGLHALFNFDLAFSILTSIQSEKSQSAVIAGPSWQVIDSISLVDGFIQNLNAFRAYSPGFINATFLSNHDQNRVASMLDANPEKIKLAASILLTLPGSPYLYYGEELGMLGMKPDEMIREPFLWEPRGQDQGRTTWEEPSYSTDDTIKPLSEQQQDPSSIFSHYKRLMELRRNSNILTLGEIAPVKNADERLVIYKRTYENEQHMIIHNLSSEPISFTMPGAGSGITFSTSGEDVINGDNITVSAYSSVILK